MASPHNPSSTNSFLPRAASNFGEEVDSLARDEGIAISFQTSACSTRGKNIEPASVLLPVPDEAEKAALSTQSGSEDINIHENEDEESISSSDEDDCIEDIESESQNIRSLPKQPPKSPASIEALPSSEVGSVSHTSSLSDV